MISRTLQEEVRHLRDEVDDLKHQIREMKAEHAPEAARLAQRFLLPPVKANILALLSSGKILPTTVIAARCCRWGADQSAVKVHISQLRRLVPFQIRGHHGKGYWVEEGDLPRLQAVTSPRDQVAA